MSAAAPKGRLTPEAHEKVYAEIRDHYLPRSEPQRQPIAIVTGGQPGSGKSGLASAAGTELAARGGFVVVDADKLRPFHPDFQKLLKEDDRTAANLTHPDSGTWAGRLMRDAVAGRRNLIIDQTTRDPEALEKISRDLRGAGYRIELRMMAVNEAVSEQRIYTRYEEQKAQSGMGRFSTKDKHDEAFAGIPKALEAAESRRLVDAVKIYDKDHNELYANRLKGPGRDWEQPAGGVKALQDERGRPMTLAEKSQLASNYAELSSMVNAPGRKASPEEKAVIERKRVTSDNVAAAEMFKQRPEAEVVAAHPGTAAAYAFLAASRKAAEHLPSKQHKDVVEDQVRKQLAVAVEKGAYPRIGVRETSVDRVSDQGKSTER